MTTPTEQTAKDKEAQEYWGYLFKPDKTGTDKLKNLLRGLHEFIGTKFEPYDSADLTPTQLARFYKDLNGNYDPLFLSTPPATVAFIFKNLGCIHSLQPLPTAAAEKRFSDPTIPALKVEGWIMWETIQLLLGPDEHAAFLMHAVEKWDIKDPKTGDLFPKVLPRSAFPTQPDAHMVAWYEGVSERLRREAEEEQNTRITAVDEEPRKQIESAERHHRNKSDRDHTHNHSAIEEEVPDSKRSALAYFRNPLFKREDGRPGVVRRDSKQTPTLMQRGKYTATSIGHVVRNVASPHLWDGGAAPNNGKEYRDHEGHREGHREREHRDKERHRRRKSVPHGHSPRDDDDADYNEDVPSPRLHPARHTGLGSRRGSQTNSAANSPAPNRDRVHWDAEPSPRHTPTERHHHRQHSSPVDHTIRHSKSHDPTPSPKEYFPPWEKYQPRRGSHHDGTISPGTPMTPGGRTSTSPGAGSGTDTIHTGFMPTASPLFATQIARNFHYGAPTITAPPPPSSGMPIRDRCGRSPVVSNVAAQGAPMRSNSGRRHEEPPRQYSGSMSKGTGDGNMGGQRPKVTRFETPVQGVHGRQYVKEGNYRGGDRGGDRDR